MFPKMLLWSKIKPRV
uniref:Uncharacterized protein n=1 Tax=Anguilla anguilla TaxID=7936 RepID=A0A0E9UB04_ANGAN